MGLALGVSGSGCKAAGRKAVAPRNQRSYLRALSMLRLQSEAHQ